MANPAAQADYGQVLHTFFCRALYDYQSNDLSSLSFKKGDIIEVLTQLESGWWDGLLNDERGWFPSNYVVQISDEEAAADLMRAGLLPGSNGTVDHDSGWMPDDEEYRQAQLDDPAPPAGTMHDTWVPEVTSDGQIYYVNTATGEVSREMPLEADSEAQATAFPSSEHSRQPTNRTRSDSTTTDDVSLSLSREPAGFGVQRRSNTPDSWTKRLYDDGMSYYYVHKVTGETRWTPPSPIFNGTTRLRADSDATYDSNRVSVYSDSSDIHPFFASSSPKEPRPQQNLPPPSEDTNAAEMAAKQLQEALLPPPSESFQDLVNTTREVIGIILEPIPNPEILSARVDQAVLAIRRLLYRSGTLVAGAKGSQPETDEILNTRLKPLQRKVTATLSKVVLSARAARFNPSFVTATLGRVQQDARDLDRTVVKFVEEVERSHLPSLENRRMTGVLLSGEGAAGIGMGLVGAGVGGGWKGLGYVPMEEAGPSRRLGASLITEFQDQKAILDEKAQVLASCFATNDTLIVQEVRDASRDFLSRLFIYTNTLADTNVARHVDVDGFRRRSPAKPLPNEDAYMQSISRARVLVRTLEVTTQALYDGGAMLLLATQTPLQTAASMIPAITVVTGYITSSVELIEDLYTVGHEQATLAAEDQVDYDYRGSISWRMSRLSMINPFDGSTIDGLTNALTSDDSANASRDTLNEDEEDMVDMEAAFSRGPRAPGINAPALAATNAMVGETESRDSTVDSQGTSFDTTGANDGASMTTVTNGNHEAQLTATLINGTRDIPDEDEEEELALPKKVLAKSNKIEKILGAEAPTRQILNAAKPFYLKADYPPQDIILNPDGSVRAATLPALVEHLTDHEYRDTNYIRTFLLTFKSFSTIDEVFDLLVKRFNTVAPTGLTDAQEEEWRKQKRDVFRIRILNIMKQIIMEDDVLDQEDTPILARIRDFAISVQDVSAPAKLLVRVAERALNGEDAIIKTITKSVNATPPASILPRMGKKMKLLDIDPTELARQMTVMESNLYNRIRVVECLMRAKEQKSKNASQDNISSIIERTNQINAWMHAQILEKEDARKRAAIIKFFIAVADRCRLMHNYSTMAALTAGLSAPPIRRLKRTWDQVGGRAMGQLEACDKTFDSNKNFNNYRTTLAKIEPPCVPFLGVYLTTLVFINEGSKDILPPPQPKISPGQATPAPPPSGPLINFAKRQKTAEVIREIKNWQTKPYNITTVTVIQSFVEDALREQGKVDDKSDYFWNRSLELEPREREDEKMARLLQESGFL